VYIVLYQKKIKNVPFIYLYDIDVCIYKYDCI
jgi:hypothetical protein